MKLRVLVVDDSRFFRRRLADILSEHPLIEIVAQAGDGVEAVRMAREFKPDVITMDVEMPEMNGIEAVRAIMRENPTPILMLSALTHNGARATLDALEAGATDFLPKQLDEVAGNHETAGRLLRKRVVAIGLKRKEYTIQPVEAVSSVKVPGGRKPVGFQASRYKVLMIGASTGGPMALKSILTELPRNFPLPIVIVQHMPAAFTQAFAERLNAACQLNIHEAADGDVLKTGNVYIAPGGKHLELTRHGIKIGEAPPETAYKPSVDAAFRSAADLLPKQVIALILTGMGTDGCEGAQKLKRNGATIWAQDEQSSVIYGMPRAVAEAGVADQVLSLTQMSASLRGDS